MNISSEVGGWEQNPGFCYKGSTTNREAMPKASLYLDSTYNIRMFWSHWFFSSFDHRSATTRYALLLEKILLKASHFSLSLFWASVTASMTAEFSFSACLCTLCVARVRMTAARDALEKLLDQLRYFLSQNKT